ncbi:site-specific DNA-methyltransferase [Neisseria animalis]|uniref:site-specific DNA-methyltransferase (adenine-specific) n=1 Tax=Neisseria animalis TaxID=492 RepID=A0A5P3MQZ7_NEIAN|nr:site-specific DNA-methyltransferase [Neisseria animalis]QEY24016.1 site-specific DNA-methyltransferase [Neisseria animalis]ROW32583.1 site-specific DNA-methyltransferase [Neisseria animalis]VEE06080.1 type iii restriction-modification system methyltransferase [Neisseria animalis]
MAQHSTAQHSTAQHSTAQHSSLTDNINPSQQNNLEKLKQLFPEIFCENKIDWEKLKLVLGEENLADHNEHYCLNWAGKSSAYRTLQSPSFNTLSPCKEESVNFDTTQNLFIEAENMEALKILQKAYAGTVKMIYIDPPYNTGNDSFIYPDKFSETREEYAKRVGDKDAEGYIKRDGIFQGAFRKNSKDNGHYHSNWLSMMLPRLHLAKTLLRDDGVIFISIDDNEQAQLKLLCDEVFGAENFVASLPTIMNLKGNNDEFGFAGTHEYTIVYMKNKSSVDDLNGIPLTEEDFADYDQEDEKGKFYQGATLMRTGEDGAREQRPNGYYPIFVSRDYSRMSVEKLANDDFIVYPITKDGKEMSWRRSKDTLSKSLNEFIIKHSKNGKISFYKKQRLEDDIASGKKAKSLFYKPAYSSGNGTEVIKKLFNKKIFQNPKPLELLKNLIRIGSNEGDLICDFFCGSGSFAHAIMELNLKIKEKQRQYICIQLPEELNPKDKKQKMAYEFCQSLGVSENIAEISKERIRRAGAQILQNLPENHSLDIGFKVFKLSESNFKQWQTPKNNEVKNIKAQLDIFQDIVEPTATVENMAYELALRLGFQLTDSFEFADYLVWLNDKTGKRKTALLLTQYHNEMLNHIIDAQPQKVFALDKVFNGNDALKANLALQLKDAGIAFETF